MNEEEYNKNDFEDGLRNDVQDEVFINLKEIILQNKKYKFLEERFVEFILINYFSKNGDKFKQLINLYKAGKSIQKNQKSKEIIKTIKKELNIIFGNFDKKNYLRRVNLINELYEIIKYNEREIDSNILNEQILKILKLHKSTNERIDCYPEIYKLVFSNIPKINGIADLGSGINPLSLLFIIEKLKKENIKVFAGDITVGELKEVQRVFKMLNLDLNFGYVNLLDLESFKDLLQSKLLGYNTIFLFKVFDSLEMIKKNRTKEILDLLSDKYIVASFPTITLKSKKSFKNPERNWFKKYLEKKNRKFHTFKVGNEIFYIIQPDKLCD